MISGVQLPRRGSQATDLTNLPRRGPDIGRLLSTHPIGIERSIIPVFSYMRAYISTAVSSEPGPLCRNVAGRQQRGAASVIPKMTSCSGSGGSMLVEKAAQVPPAALSSAVSWRDARVSPSGGGRPPAGCARPP